MVQEVVQPYGPAFKQLREKRGITQKQAAGEIVSTQFLRKFEKGASSITLEKFGRLLIAIGASWEDFFAYYSGESISKELALAEAICTKIDSGRHYDGLKMIDAAFEGNYRDNSSLQPVFELAFQSLFHSLQLTSKLSSKELAAILRYLDTIETWGQFEYTIFKFIIFDCPYGIVKYRADLILRALSQTKKTCLKTKKDDIYLLLYAISYFSKNAYYKEADFFTAKLDKELSTAAYPRYFTEKYLLRLQEAVTYLRQDNPKGLEIAKKCLQFLESYECLAGKAAAAHEKHRVLTLVATYNHTGVAFKI